MKSTIEKLSTLERKLNIEVPADEVQAAFAHAFRALQKQAAVKGFRKGKTPISTLRLVFGERVRQDVVNSLVEANYSAAVQEHALDPVSYPTIEFDPIEDDKEFAFTAEFEVRPVIQAVDFEGLVLKKEAYVPDAKRVDALLEGFRNSLAQAEPVLEDRPAQKGDLAVLDFDGFLFDGPFEGGSGRGHELELGSHSFIPGFEEGIEGMRLGEEKSLRLAFPDAYEPKELAGKPVTFRAKLTALKKRVLPDLDDALASKVGPFASLQELREKIAKEIEATESKRIDEDVRNRAMRALVDRNPVDVPKSLHAEQKKALIKDLRKRLSAQGLDEAKIEEYKQNWDRDFDMTASYMIRANFLIDAIANQQDIQATQADVEKKLKEFAAESRIDAGVIREFYADPERKAKLAYQVREQKVLDFLIAKANVREASREELESEKA